MKNPYLNAASATAYIGALVLFMQYIQSIRHDTPDTPIDGIGAISLFVFSAAIMAFLFFYEPVTLLIESKKADAFSFFLKTLLTFGTITIIVLTFVSLQ